MTKRALRHFVVSRPTGSYELVLAALVLSSCLVFAANRRSLPLASPSARSVLQALGLAGELPVVLVAFQIMDCADARAELRQWNDVRGVRVVGVLIGPVPGDDKVTSSVLERSGVSFPVLRRGAPELERLLRSLGFRRTPIIIAFDARGRLVEARSISGYSHHRRVDALVSRLAAPEGA